MAITDGLRGWALHINENQHRGHLTDAGKQGLCNIADRIDAAHRSALEKLAAQVDESGALPMTDENMAEHGWVRGPLDANGEMWRCGDMSDSNWGVIEGITYADGKWFISGHDVTAPWIPADSIRHYHDPTVEDVLREFAEKIIDSQIPNVHPTYEEAISEFAAKLRLAGEGE